MGTTHTGRPFPGAPIGEGETNVCSAPARLLVVAAHRLTRPYLQRLLEADGYSVDVPADEAAAVDKIGAGCDLLLIDLAHAPADGLALCKRVRAAADGSYLPVVVLAAADDPEQRRAAL